MKHCINWNNAILYILFWWITRSKNKLLNLHSVQIEKGNIALVLQNEMILISNVQYIESIWLWLISVGTTKINFQNIFVFFLLSRWELFSLSFCLMLVQFVPVFHPPFYIFFLRGGGVHSFFLEGPPCPSCLIHWPSIYTTGFPISCWTTMFLFGIWKMKNICVIRLTLFKCRKMTNLVQRFFMADIIKSWKFLLMLQKKTPLQFPCLPVLVQFIYCVKLNVGKLKALSNVCSTDSVKQRIWSIKAHNYYLVCMVFHILIKLKVHEEN